MSAIPPKIPSTPTRPRQKRLESIRPFVKKYQYCQLPLPEPNGESFTSFEELDRQDEESSQEQSCD